VLPPRLPEERPQLVLRPVLELPVVMLPVAPAHPVHLVVEPQVLAVPGEDPVAEVQVAVAPEVAAEERAATVMAVRYPTWMPITKNLSLRAENVETVGASGVADSGDP
jgi:hypothetical protein